MPIRMAITKVSGQGEQLVIDISQWNPVTGEIVHEDMGEMFLLQHEALQAADLRLQEMNLRHLEAYQLEKWCTPNEWQKIGDVLEILSGRVDAATVAHRWKSALEETAALEDGRLAYAIQQQKDQQDVYDEYCKRMAASETNQHQEI